MEENEVLEKGISSIAAEDKDSAVKPVRFFPSWRFGVGLTCSLGIVTMMIARVNLSFAVVCMVRSPVAINGGTRNATNVNGTSSLGVEDGDSTLNEMIIAKTENDSLRRYRKQDEECPGLVISEDSSNNSWNSMHEEGEFDWSRVRIGVILSAAFFGFVITQSLGAATTSKFSLRKVVLVVMIILTVLSLLTPAAARFHVYGLFAIRILLGSVMGFFMPSIFGLLGQWSLPGERSRMVTIVMSGYPLGAAINHTLSSYLCRFRWPTIFYASGCICATWTVIAYFLIYDSFNQHPRISKEERKYMLKCLPKSSDGKRKKVQIPYKAVFTSRPYLATVFANFCGMACLYSIVLNLPLYVRDVLHLSTSQNGVWSSMPALGMFASMLAVGPAFDSLSKRSSLPLTTQRKLATAFGFLIPAICQQIIVWLPCESTIGPLVLLVMSLACYEASIVAGNFPALIEMAPMLSGFLIGIAKTVGNMSGIIMPMIVAAFTELQGPRKGWKSVFHLNCAIYFIGTVVFCLFGSSELQPWAYGAKGGAIKVKCVESSHQANDADVNMRLTSFEGEGDLGEDEEGITKGSAVPGTQHTTEMKPG